MATLKNMIRDRFDSAGDGISDIAAATRRHARAAGKSMRGAASDGQELASDLYDDTLATLRNTGQLARERPASTIAVMIVGGLLIGGLYTFLRRR